MSADILRMKYHPAKKAVEFQRFPSDSDQEIPFRSDAPLKQYMDNKGDFILQNQEEKSFFGDIVRTFDGQSEVKMQVITTKIDYEDFEQMIEYFNRESKCKINATLLTELPSMDIACSDIEVYGRKSMNILLMHQSIFKDFRANQKNDIVKKYVDSFLKVVQREIDGIQGKMSGVADNRVNLCFTGVHSSGKSVLINAILGHRILPVDLASKTARIFRIQSPKENEQVRIAFNIHEEHTILEWGEEEAVFRSQLSQSESGRYALI